MDLMKQLELNWWNGKGGIDGINETHGIKRNWKKLKEIDGTVGIDEMKSN